MAFDKKKFNILPVGMTNQRLDAFPLDSSELHATLADAMHYAQNNPTAYAGQILYVADARTEEDINNGVELFEALFMINAEKELKLVKSEADAEVADLKSDLDETMESLGKPAVEGSEAIPEHFELASPSDEGAMVVVPDGEVVDPEKQVESSVVGPEFDEGEYVVLVPEVPAVEGEEATGLHKEVADNKAELESDIDDLRKEMTEDLAEMEQKMEQVHEEMKAASDLIHGEMEAAAEEIHGIIQEKIEADHKAMQEAADAKYAEIDQAMAEMQEASDAKHAEMEAKMEADHKAMQEAADAKHAEIDQAMADMKAEADAKHAEMEQAAKDKHAEMEAKMEEEHAAIRDLVDIEEPYLADIPAYPTSKFLFACGQPMTVEPNIGQKYSADHAEDAVAFVYRWAEGFKSIMVDKDEAAKVYIVGGHGVNKVFVKRPIPQTNILVRDVKIKGIVGGSYFEGMVGHANIEAENCEFASIIGAGWCGANLEGEVTRMNVVDDVNIKLTKCKVSSTLYGGSQGNGVADDVHMELNDCEIGWLTAGGANGMTRNAEIVMNGGSAKVVQSTNRGVVYKAKFVLNDGVVDKLYYGGETEDASVTGLIEKCEIELKGGQVNKFANGTSNGIEIASKDVKGLMHDNVVVKDGDVSMFKVIRIVEHGVPYISRFANKVYMFACGFPIFVDKAENGDIVGTYNFRDELKQLVVPAEEESKLIVCGGFGELNLHENRDLARTDVHVRNVNILGVQGANFFEGSVCEAHVLIENATVREIIGGGDAGKQYEGRGAMRNIVGRADVVLNNVKATTAFAAASGHSSVGHARMEINGDSSVQWVTIGGANGFVNEGEVVLNGGEFVCVQSTNRGIIDKAKLVMNGGHVKRLYFGGETEDATVNGMVNHVEVELNEGKIDKVDLGTDHAMALDAAKVNGVLMEAEVLEGDVSMLKQFKNIFFGGDAKLVPCANADEVKALAGKEKSYNKEVLVVAPKGSQRITIAVPEEMKVEEIQYMGQCCDYKDMFDEEIVQIDNANYKVMTYIFAIPCAASMTFKVKLA